MKKIAAITMAMNAEDFLNKWIAYYGKELGEENLYIFLDGMDQKIPSGAGKSNITRIVKKNLPRAKGDKYRINFLSDRAKELFSAGYDLIIGCDVDEFLIVDPKIKKSLKSYLSEIKTNTPVSGLGLDFGQNRHTEKPLNFSKPFLSQREFVLLCTRYTKPVVISKPYRWGSGFHHVKMHNFKIDKNLYLLHFGNADFDTLNKKLQDQALIRHGWGNHLQRRLKVIELTTNKNPKIADKIFPIARFIQTIFRPIYAWNKPGMLGIKWIVKIPTRFKKLI